MASPPLVVIEAPGKLAAARAAFKAIGVPVDVFATQGVLFDLPENEYGLDGDGAPTAWACVSPVACERIRNASSEGREVVAWTDSDDAGEWIASQVQALVPRGFSRLRTLAMSVGLEDWEGRGDACDTESVACHLAQRLSNRAIGYGSRHEERLRVGPSVTRAVASLAATPLERQPLELSVGGKGLACRAPRAFGQPMKLPRDALKMGESSVSPLPWEAAPVREMDGPLMALAFALARGGGVMALWREAQGAYMRGEVSYHRTSVGSLAPWQRDALNRRFEGLFRAPDPPPAVTGGPSTHGAWVPLRNAEGAAHPELVSQLCDYWLERSEGSEFREAGRWVERRRPRKRSPFASWRQSAKPPVPSVEVEDALWRRLAPLATPSGIGGLALRMRGLIDRAGRLNAEGWASLRRAESVSPGLLEPGSGERLAALQADPSASVLDRVAASVREAGARPPNVPRDLPPAPPVWAEVPLR